MLNVVQLREPNLEDHMPIIRLAKNLAWELKPETPMFEDYTVDSYWRAQPKESKLRYIAAVEQTIAGLITEIDREKALANVTRTWLQGVLEP